MSCIPEKVLHRAILRGWRAYKLQPRLLDPLFTQATQAEMEMVRDYVRRFTPDVVIGFTGQQKVPAIHILLKQDAEDAQGGVLGDLLGTVVPSRHGYDGSAPGAPQGAASRSPAWGEGEVVFGPWRASGGSRTRLSIDSKEWTASQFAGGSYEVRILVGAGEGDVVALADNEADALAPVDPFSASPDATSIFEVVRRLDEEIGEPSSVADRRDPRDRLEEVGEILSASYQIQVVGPNPEMAIYMAAMVRGSLLGQRVFLERNGIQALRTGATDYGPRLPNLPDNAWQRTINVDFRTVFSGVKAVEQIAEEIRMVLEGPDGDVLSDTTISDVLPTVEVGG